MDGGGQPVDPKRAALAASVRLLDGKEATGKTLGLPSAFFPTPEEWMAVVTLKFACKVALLDVSAFTAGPNGRPIQVPQEPDEKRKRYVLAQRIMRGETDWSSEELDLLVRSVEEAYRPEPMGAILEALGAL